MVSNEWLMQQYDKGVIYWHAGGTFVVYGAIYSTYKQQNLHRGHLGFPLNDETAVGDGKGRYNDFQHGSIYWTKETDARVINHGDIYTKWKSKGGAKGYLGYPSSNEGTTPDKIGSYLHFQGGSIYKGPMYHYDGTYTLYTHIVHSKIREEWERRRWERGLLGYPSRDTEGIEQDGTISSTLRNSFYGGDIEWNQAQATGYSVGITGNPVESIKAK